MNFYSSLIYIAFFKVSKYILLKTLFHNETDLLKYFERLRISQKPQPTDKFLLQPSCFLKSLKTFKNISILEKGHYIHVYSYFPKKIILGTSHKFTINSSNFVNLLLLTILLIFTV